MEDFTAYIESLEDAGIKMTKSQWYDWIRHEDDDFASQNENHERITEGEIESVLNQLEEDEFINVKYEVDYTDPETGATSPIDTIYAAAGYTAEQYVEACECYAYAEYCEMLKRGTVTLTEID